MQSRLPSWELLYYVLLPQFKSQELESNAPQTGLGPQTEYVWSCVKKAGSVFMSDILREINIKSFYVNSQPSAQSYATLPLEVLAPVPIPSARRNHTSQLQRGQTALITRQMRDLHTGGIRFISSRSKLCLHFDVY